MGDVFLVDHSVHVLTFVLVRIDQRDDLYERIKINRVVEKSTAWSDCLHCILGRFDHHSTPLVRVNTELFDYFVNHLGNVRCQFFVNPCFHMVTHRLLLIGWSLVTRPNRKILAHHLTDRVPWN
jgi:hypothetical protein